MIREFKATHARKVRGTDIKKGQTLYAVEYITAKYGRIYFIWAYSSKKMAEYIEAKFPDGPESMQDRECNYRVNLSDLIPTDATI